LKLGFLSFAGRPYWVLVCSAANLDFYSLLQNTIASIIFPMWWLKLHLQQKVTVEPAVSLSLSHNLHILLKHSQGATISSLSTGYIFGPGRPTSNSCENRKGSKTGYTTYVLTFQE
jgi:hypothetical protein